MNNEMERMQKRRWSNLRRNEKTHEVLFTIAGIRTEIWVRDPQIRSKK
jgi:hypothetical protein